MMSSLSLFHYILLFFCVSLLTANGDEEAKKEKKQLSPARLRAEGDAAFANRDYNKAIKYFNQLIGMQNNQ